MNVNLVGHLFSQPSSVTPGVREYYIVTDQIDGVAKMSRLGGDKHPFPILRQTVKTLLNALVWRREYKVEY